MLIMISVDKIAIVADVDYGFDKAMNDKSDDYIGPMIPVYGSPQYRWGWKCRDGTYVQYGCERSSENRARVEFNPNKCISERVKKILGTLKNAELTRCDLAFDYNSDLSDYSFIDNASRKWTEVHARDGKLETYYIGSRRSDSILRIYDKAKEQKVNKGKEKGEKKEIWWRVEAELHRNYLYYFSMTKDIVNPFDDLSIKKYSFDSLKFEDYASVKTLLREPKLWGKLTPYQRRKYKKILVNLDSDEDLGINKEFEKNKDRLIETVWGYLSACHNYSTLTRV